MADPSIPSKDGVSAEVPAESCPKPKETKPYLLDEAVIKIGPGTLTSVSNSAHESEPEEAAKDDPTTEETLENCSQLGETKTCAPVDLVINIGPPTLTSGLSSKLEETAKDVLTAEETLEVRPQLGEKKTCLSSEALINIAIRLLDEQQYGSFQALSAASTQVSASLQIVARKFVVVNVQGKSSDALVDKARTAHVQYLLLFGTFDGKQDKAITLSALKREGKDGSHALKGVGHWSPRTTLAVYADEETASATVEDAGDVIKHHRHVDIFSSTVSGTTAHVVGIDQAADILLIPADSTENLDRTAVQLNLIWKEEDGHVHPVGSALPSVAFFNANWVINMNGKKCTTAEETAWAISLARIVIGGLANNCSPLGTYQPWERAPYDSRPSIEIFGVMSMKAARALVMMLCDVYDTRPSAVKVRISIEVHLPAKTPLPSCEVVLGLLGRVPPALSRGIEDQKLWELKRHACKPDIRLDIFTTDGDGSSILATLGIAYLTPYDREWYLNRGKKPRRAILTRVRVRNPRAWVATDDSDSDEDEEDLYEFTE